MEQIGISNDEFINKLNFNSENDDLLFPANFSLTKPHVDKLVEYQWVYNDSQVSLHPSTNLSTSQKLPDVWRFEGIGWAFTSDGHWKGIEHQNSSLKFLPDVGGWQDLHFGPTAESATHH